MAPGSKVYATGDGQSGGKIVTRRRIAARKTPYDRPVPLPESPNWFSGLAFPARMVASGAGKLLSSFWNPEAWSSPSSSSESDSEDDVENDTDDYEIPSDGVIELNQNNNNSSGIIKSSLKEPQLSARKSETMRLIEQLLMHENFSREECDRLIAIMKSRVVDCSMNEVLDPRLNQIPRGRIDDETPDICSQAVMEAKKWLKEKKAGLSSKSDHGTFAFTSVPHQHGTERDAVSPEDIAKSYMGARPPWASPFGKRNELETPLSKATDMFNEVTPNSKRDYLSTGSWNIQEEIRRLRSKATEDMLSSCGSKKIDFASFALDHKTAQDSLAEAKTIEVINTKSSNSLTAPKAVDEHADLTTGVSSHGLSVSALEIEHNDSMHTEELPSNAHLLDPQQNQDLNLIEMVEGEGAASKSHHAVDPEVELNQVVAVTETPTATSSGSLQFNLPAVLENGQDNRQEDTVPVEGTCELLTETSVEVPTMEGTFELLTETLVEVPTVDETRGLHYDESSQERTQVNKKRGSVGKTSRIIEKQLGKKPNRYSRKVRGKAK